MSKNDPWDNNEWDAIIPKPKPVQQKPVKKMQMERPPDSWNVATGPEGRNRQLPSTIRQPDKPQVAVVNTFPNERFGICTECNTPAINVKECQSMDSTCRYRHCWHYCTVHKNRVRGRFRPIPLENSYCTCNVNPVQFNLPKKQNTQSSGNIEYFDVSGGDNY